ncbi:hypothetical protein AK812_SmicGene41939 [Symbiodinium microadriaticum]|uniref:Uncharacterized protein n=1 Tax=Symbiodinium microadriaticum TaxID=2951 RepID=A0A1Q9C4U7_SYMMI|nr:hypothetical protein AK812_SmicGene41939 [Symbiodinium microadriaticum]CAE7440024.1 unnamed protein product [Symbiodinium microadriaticum]CAE7639944.1 unnamed protein product [Symbiodinium sp. KB8]
MAAERTGRDPELPEAQTFTQALQGSLNGTRKVEQRVVSLQSGLTRRQAMWEAYLRDMKDALRREQARFVKDMEKLRADLGQALHQQEEARAELVSVAALAGRAPARPPPDNRVDRIFEAWCAEVVRHLRPITRLQQLALWDLRLAWLPPASGDVDAVMSEVDALTGHLAGQATPAPNAAAEATSFGGAPSPEHGPYADFVTRDPYLPSPGQTALRPRMTSVSPRIRPGPYERTEEEETAPGGPAAANALASALAATRAATPFSRGIPPNIGSLRSIEAPTLLLVLDRGSYARAELMECGLPMEQLCDLLPMRCEPPFFQ